MGPYLIKSSTLSSTSMSSSLVSNPYPGAVKLPLTTARGNRGGDSFPLVTATRPFWTTAGEATGMGRGGEVVSKLVLGDSVSRLLGKFVWVAMEVMEEEATTALEEDKEDEAGM